jgi:hypothetical protein
MTFHPQLHERITTVSALFPGSKLELLVLDEGTAMVETIHGTCHCSVLLDDGGRRAIIVALGGLPMDKAMQMVQDMEAEAAASQDQTDDALHITADERDAATARVAELEVAVERAIRALRSAGLHPEGLAASLEHVLGRLVI